MCRGALRVERNGIVHAAQGVDLTAQPCELRFRHRVLLQQGFDAIKIGGQSRKLVTHLQHPGSQQQQLRPLIDKALRQQAQPMFKLLPSLFIHGLVAMRLNHLHRSVFIAGRQRVADGFFDKTVAGIPGAGVGVECDDFLRTVALLQLVLQQLPGTSDDSETTAPGHPETS